MNVFLLNEHDIVKVCPDQETAKLVSDIMDSAVFKRLLGINFLGAISYRNRNRINNKIGSRFQHSLGVARLALEFANLTELPSKDTRLLVASALLHDIGHAPLSHSLEPIFKKNFGINHHDATANVIRGESPLGKSILSILKSQDISTEEVIGLIDGHSSTQFATLFSGAINIDTIDGILRTLAIFGLKSTTKPLAVVKSLLELEDKDIGLLDEFWSHKNFVYQNCIYEPRMHTLDAISQEYLQNNLDAFSKNCFYKTERQLKKSVPQLFQLIKHFGSLEQDSSPLRSPENTRQFHINSTVDGTVRSTLDSRYYVIRKTTAPKKAHVEHKRQSIPHQIPLCLANE